MQEELLTKRLTGVLARGAVFLCVDARTALVLEGLLLGRIAAFSSLPTVLASASRSTSSTAIRLSPEEAFFMAFALEVLFVITDASSASCHLLSSDRLRVASSSSPQPVLVRAPPAHAKESASGSMDIGLGDAYYDEDDDADADGLIPNDDDDEPLNDQDEHNEANSKENEGNHAPGTSTAAAFTPSKRKACADTSPSAMPADHETDDPLAHESHIPLMHQTGRLPAPSQLPYQQTDCFPKLSTTPLQQADILEPDPEHHNSSSPSTNFSPGPCLIQHTLAQSDANNSERDVIELDHEALWRTFCKLLPGFPACYAAYHRCRANGWLPKSGLQYGADYVLYRAHPAVAHSEYVAVVLPESTKVGGHVRQAAKEAGYPDWRDQQAISRLSIQVSKGVLAIHVEGGQRGFVTSTPQCLLHLQVHSVQIVRWNPNRAMKNLSADGGGAAGDANEIDAQAVDQDEINELGAALGDDD